MPFTAQEISDAGKAALDFYLKNKPVDQIQTERPWIRKLMMTARTFPGTKQYVVEQLRKTYGSNFQWYYGAQAVTYNSRQTLEQSQFAWHGAHDGFFLDEDRLLQNGITISESQRGGNNTQAERMQLTNLLEEQNESLRLGFEEKFDYELHQDGTQDTEALAGLEGLVKDDPTSGTVGGIDQSANTWWRNQTVTGLGSSTILTNMESIWRLCTRNGGRPDFILMGSDFVDTYVTAARAEGNAEWMLSRVGRVDPAFPVGERGNNDLQFKGVPIVWDPVMADLDANLSPSIDYEKRCYFINCRHMRLRPAEGHNMVSRKPPREYNRYVFYWAITWKGALTTNRLTGHAFLSIS